jgi:hypothetical protein
MIPKIGNNSKESQLLMSLDTSAWAFQAHDLISLARLQERVSGTCCEGNMKHRNAESKRTTGDQTFKRNQKISPYLGLSPRGSSVRPTNLDKVPHPESTHSSLLPCHRLSDAHSPWLQPRRVSQHTPHSQAQSFPAPLGLPSLHTPKSLPPQGGLVWDGRVYKALNPIPGQVMPPHLPHTNYLHT